MLRLPAKLCHRLSWVNPITTVVPWAILHISNQGFRLAKLLKNCFNDVYIRPFIISTDIVYFAITTIMNNKINSTAVILNIQPITNVQSIPVNRKLFICQSF
ncbi:hypothetical protein D3C81_1700070 [compost metagenome]